MHPTQFHFPFSTKAALLVALCGACQPAEDADNLERDPFAEPDLSGLGKADGTLCGLDCSVPGEECVRACGSEDTCADTFVSASVSGDATNVVDSRDRYELDIYDYMDFFYGCDVWDYSNAPYDGFEIKYSESWYRDHWHVGRRWWVYFEPLLGPGSYVGDAYFAPSHEAHEAGDYYWENDACAVEVESDGAGGLRGTFSCDSVGHKSGTGSVRMAGEFACGQSSLERVEIDLALRDEECL